MPQSFNTPQHAIRWLKKRGLIGQTEGLTVYEAYRPMRLMVDPYTSAPPDPKARLDDEAEAMLKTYGYSFKKPKRVPTTSWADIPIPSWSSVTGGRVEMVNGSSIMVDSVSNESIRGFSGIVRMDEEVLPHHTAMSTPEVGMTVEEDMADTHRMVGMPILTPVAKPSVIVSHDTSFDDQCRRFLAED